MRFWPPRHVGAARGMVVAAGQLLMNSSGLRETRMLDLFACGPGCPAHCL